MNSPTSTALSVLDLLLLKEAVEKAHAMEEEDFVRWWQTDEGTIQATRKAGIRIPARMECVRASTVPHIPGGRCGDSIFRGTPDERPGTCSRPHHLRRVRHGDGNPCVPGVRLAAARCDMADLGVFG